MTRQYDNHHHEHHDHDHEQPHPKNEDDDVELTQHEAKFLALKAMLIEKGILTADEIRARLEKHESRSPEQAARMVAKSWVDPAFRARMITDPKAAARELGIEVTEAALVTLVNEPHLHNMVVCTLCSCYPRSLLGEPPAFYVSKAYRSRAVREPRKVLREFGLNIAEDVEVRVSDSNADLRYFVVPMRPPGTEALSEEELAALVTRDCLVGCALPRPPTVQMDQTTD
jgi:antitoxin component of MazEF toxin-antitoxin module